MDPMARLSQKQTTQSLHQQLHQQQPTPDSAPPPYMPSEHDDYEDDSDDDEDNDHHPAPSPLKLTLNATHNIQGSNNLVPTSPSPLADATRFSTLLLAAVKQLNSVAATASEPLPSSSSSRRLPASKRGAALTVDLTINCGVTIVGDRNVVGNVCLKPKAPAQAFAGPAAAHPSTSNAATTTVAAAPRETADHAVVGAKRKADEDEDDVGREGRYAKKVAMG